MLINQPSPLYEKVLDYLIEKATPQEILAFKVGEAAQERAHDLMERNNAGTITSEEAVELEQVLQIERFMAVLKARALMIFHA
jgi:hypothetical protein